MELCDRGAVELAGMLAAGEVSAREVTEAHLARIDRANPDVNAIITLVPELALVAAEEADRRFTARAPLGPLHGLPVAHKDLVETKGIRTTMGSPLHADWVPSQDALVVTRMRDAGAITLGKTNTPEFGAGSHTFNTLFGATHNPHARGYSAGGSSGGAAAALGAGMVALADGSDLGGSLRNPASFCGVVGLRPSPGRVPSWPDPHPWDSMAVIGPMGRRVADVALFLSAIAGPDARCPVSLDDDPSLFGRPLTIETLKGVRIAYSPRLGDLPVEGEVAAVVERAVIKLEWAGAQVELADPPLRGADEAFETLRALRMESSHGPTHDERPRMLKETIRWNIEQGRRLSGPDVGRAELLRGQIFAATGAFFERFDALVTVVSQVPPFPVDWEFPAEVAGTPMSSYIEWMRSCSRITVTSCPALSVPAGTTPDGLPVGIQVVAPYRRDRRLLEIGHAIETALG